MPVSKNQMSKRAPLPDRRSWDSGPVPIEFDSAGNVVLADRRQIPDRRWNNIEVEFRDSDEVIELRGK